MGAGLATYLEIAESNIVKQEETAERRLDAHMEETTFVCYAANFGDTTATNALQTLLTTLKSMDNPCTALSVETTGDDACSVSGIAVVTKDVDVTQLAATTTTSTTAAASGSTTAGSTTASGSTTHAGTTASRRLAAHSRLTLIL